MLMFLRMVITMGLVGLKPAREVKLWRGFSNNQAFAEWQKCEGMRVDPAIFKLPPNSYSYQPHSCRG